MVNLKMRYFKITAYSDPVILHYFNIMLRIILKLTVFLKKISILCYSFQYSVMKFDDLSIYYCIRRNHESSSFRKLPKNYMDKSNQQ